MKQKEQQHLVLSIKKLMGNVEDVEKLLIIIKRKHVQAVDFLQQQWEDLMAGEKN